MSDQWWSAARQQPGGIPFRSKFDAARDPLTARNAIGAVDAKYVTDAIAAAGGGGGGAPTTAEYITAAADATLSAERVLTNTATVTWDFSTAGQAKANVAVSYQPLDADLTAIAALTGTDTIYYRNGTSTWAAVTIGANLTFSGGTLTASGGGGGTIPSNFLSGLALSNNGADAVNDLDIATGAAVDTTNVTVMPLTSGITKRLDATWAVGTNQGGLDTGAAADGTYHVWLIQRSDTGVVDALFSLSATAPTMPTSYDRKRRIGTIIRQGATILAFNQFGDRFYYITGLLDVNVTNQGVSRTLRTMTVPPDMIAMLRVYGNNTSAFNIVVQPTFETDGAPSQTAVPLMTLFGQANAGGASYLEVPVDASAQLATRANIASTTLRLLTLGWIDNRGK